MFYWKFIIWLSILLHKVLFSHKFQLSELNIKEVLWFMGWVFCFFLFDATWNKWEQICFTKVQNCFVWKTINANLHPGFTPSPTPHNFE